MIALLALLLAPARAGPLTYDQVAAYFADHSGGSIVPAERVDERFEVVHGSPAEVRTDPPRPPWKNVGLFKFDVRAFLAGSGAANVLDARRAFYAKLDYLHHEQMHARPYAYLDAWGQLFHPPIEHLDLPLTAYTDLFPPERVRNRTFYDPAFQRHVDEVSGTGMTRGNEVVYLRTDQSYQEKLRMVREARKSLYVAVMFYGCDRTSDTLAGALIERAKAGVDVRVLTEMVYRSFLSRRCMDRLQLGGVKVLTVDDALKAKTFQSVMHQKLWIRDDEEMVIGGANILDYENLGNGFNQYDRDADLWMRGPGVRDAEERFLVQWDARRVEPGDDERLAAVRARIAAEHTAGLRGAENYPKWLADPAVRDHGLCRVAMQDQMAADQPIAPIVEAYLAASHDLVVFNAPAMRPSSDDPPWLRTRSRVGQVLNLLERRTGPDGPRLMVMSNGSGGAAGELGIWLFRQSSRMARYGGPHRLLSQFREVVSRRSGYRNRLGALELQRLNPHAEVWQYYQHLHSKTWLFDRTASLVGSWNLDVNSGDMNYEAAVVCLDEGLRKALEHDDTLSLLNAVPVASRNGQ